MIVIEVAMFCKKGLLSLSENLATKTKFSKLLNFNIAKIMKIDFRQNFKIALFSPSLKKFRKKFVTKKLPYNFSQFYAFAQKKKNLALN
jgi:hypothetical protein